MQQEPSAFGAIATFFFLAIIVTAISATIGVSMWSAAKTTPVMNNFQDMKEGFAGPAKGAGMPDCLSTSSDCAKLSEMLSSRKSTTEEGPDDVREIQVILSKIACFKRDLLGNAKVVQATRYQPFNTSHDMEPVAETTARCFSRTIPQRDLSLTLDKWGSRGTFLIKRACTSLNFSDGEEEKALDLFGRAMADISDIALGECCTSADAVIGGVPQKRMVEGATPAGLIAHRAYDGYY